jgi:hypothetical protein
MMVALNRAYQIIGRTSFGRWWALGVGVGGGWCLRKQISHCILAFLLRAGAIEARLTGTPNNLLDRSGGNVFRIKSGAAKVA